MPTVTIYIAHVTHHCWAPTASSLTPLQLGHMWYVIEDGSGQSYSFGFAPKQENQGKPFAPGKVYTNDLAHYAFWRLLV